MSNIQRRIIQTLLRIAEVLLVPLTFGGGCWLGIARRYGIQKLPLTRTILFRIGVFPIRDHYYEPQFKFEPGSFSESRERALPGISLNLKGQLELLDRFQFQGELLRFPKQQTNIREFYYQNRQFGAGDAEYLYSLVRLVKPQRIIEIGCGFSTLMIRNAVNQNRSENQSYECLHTCIEPYENPWLAQVDVKLVRQRLENLAWTDFACLARNDILFIDSSHIIRSGGDVLYECLEILPKLQQGVYVHVHDIFTPFDYPEQWVRQEVRFWNEQYLVEAFLTGNCDYVIVGAMHFLSRRFP
jgi:hypothetical protein